MQTLGMWKATIAAWTRETNPASVVVDATNDAIEELSMAAMKANLSLMMGGPVSLNIAAGTERQQIVSVADPLTNPVTATVVQGALPGRTVYNAFSYVTDSGSQTNISPVQPQVVGANSLCQQNAPLRNTTSLGWNCYMGSSPQNLALQNSIPLTFSQNFLEPNTGAVDAPDLPLPPTENTTADDIFYIRHMELPLPSAPGTYKKWEQSDIDSELMRSMSRRIASNNEYQNYAYDLVNMRQLELRPAAGMTLNPRYFWVHKPRRLRFDQSIIPFFSFPSEPFLRPRTLSGVYQMRKEWSTSGNYAKQAQMALDQISTAIAQMNWAKEQTVQPYMR